MYCADGYNLPPAFEIVMVLLKTPDRKTYRTAQPAHYQVNLDEDSDGGSIKWYMFEKPIAAQVVAWLYIPKNLEISQDKVCELIKTGEMML